MKVKAVDRKRRGQGLGTCSDKSRGVTYRYR